MVKAVIFDIDNTLYDYDRADAHGRKAVSDYCRNWFDLEDAKTQEFYLEAWKIAEQRVGTDTAAIHNRMIRFQCMMELLGRPLFPHVQNLYHAYWDAMLAHMKPYPGVERVFQKLREMHIKIGIGTDMTAYIQYRKLEKLGLSAYIDMIVTSEEAGVEKPHPDFFRLCVEKAGCAAQEAVFIGDNLKKDVAGAAAGGLHGVWYSCGKQPDRDMSFPVIHTFEDDRVFMEQLIF